MEHLLDVRTEATYQGCLGRKENMRQTGEIHRKYLYPYLLQNNIQIKRVNGEEGHLIPRETKDFAGWNDAVSRFTSSTEAGGLVYHLYDVLAYRKKPLLCMAWLPPVKEQKKRRCPKINVPSSIFTIEELQEVCEHLNLYYLVFNLRSDSTPTKYSFGRYADIPIKYWYGWNKNKGKKINSVNFSACLIPQYVLSSQCTNLAGHIRREMTKVGGR